MPNGGRIGKEEYGDNDDYGDDDNDDRTTLWGQQ